MALQGFLLSLETGTASGAQSNGEVYLGLGGREFYVDSRLNDFEPGQINYAFGSTIDQLPSWGSSPYPPGAHAILHPEFNDPRQYPILEADIGANPMYIRFVPATVSGEPDRNDNWQLTRATLTMITESLDGIGGSVIDVRTPGPVWLGFRRGLVVHFIRTNRQ